MPSRRNHNPFNALLALALLLGSQLSPAYPAERITGVTKSQEEPAFQRVETGEGDLSLAITSQQAISLAVNRFEPSSDGFSLKHPQYEANFSSQGVLFAPRRSTLTWSWKLSAVSAGETPLPGVTQIAVSPIYSGIRQ